MAVSGSPGYFTIRILRPRFCAQSRAFCVAMDCRRGQLSPRSGSFMRSLVGLVMTLLIVFGTYKLFFAQLQSTGSAAPARAIDVVGVKNDLVALAQAERMYQAEHNSSATLEELNANRAMTLTKTGRNGYTYEAEPS